MTDETTRPNDTMPCGCFWTRDAFGDRLAQCAEHKAGARYAGSEHDADTVIAVELAAEALGLRTVTIEQERQKLSDAEAKATADRAAWVEAANKPCREHGLPMLTCGLCQSRPGKEPR